MSQRLLLVCHATTAGGARLGADGPLTDRARAHAAELRRFLPRPRRSSASPARCARETAVALGIEPRDDAALADWDLGAWRGRTMAEVGADDPAAVRAWQADPTAAPHGGESMAALIARAAAWTDGLAGEQGTRAAVTHAAVIRALLVHVAGAPASFFWTVQIAPTSVTELRLSGGRWQLARMNWEKALISLPGPHARRAGA